MAQIKVFSTPTCPYCIRAKDYLATHNIPFVVVDVATDTAGLDEMVRLSGQMGVPVLVVDGEVIVGFDRGRLDQKLGL